VDAPGDVEVVVIGGGFAGSAIATVLERGGHHCRVLERDEVFEDRTKGEWIAPWGVAEAQRVGIVDDIRRARGHVLTRHVGFAVDVDPADAMAAAVPLGVMPGVDGPLTQRHPDACQALFDAAGAAGASTLRGVTDVEVAPGSPGASPTVAYTHGGVRHAVRPRLVIAADGRNSAVRRAHGLELRRDPPHHLFSGLLVDDADGWPEDLQMTGTEGEVHYLAFPQGGGRVRLYLGFGFERRRWLAGADGPRRFVDAFRLRSVAHADTLAGATPVSPCAVYANEATWLDDPTALDGVVFVGDAAGWDDPITGQGLSVSLHDVRVVAELLLASPTWDRATLAPYVAERAERMRRLRFASGLTSVLANEFGPDADARRRSFRARSAADPSLGAGRFAAFLGPDAFPAEAFTPQEWDRALAG
jgi:2-polyprenyl-6-methoxyphenol hydroxylase-like FAD-dependent oxidoreductase